MFAYGLRGNVPIKGYSRINFNVILSIYSGAKVFNAGTPQNSSTISMTKYRNHTVCFTITPATAVAFDLLWYDVVGASASTSYSYTLMSGIASAGSYYVAFGGDSPVYQGYVFTTGYFVLSPTGNNAFTMSDFKLIQQG